MSFFKNYLRKIFSFKVDTPEPEKIHTVKYHNYDAELVDKLKKDHQSLLSLAGEMKTLIDTKKWTKLPPVLTKFRKEFCDHIFTENGYLYHHLKFHFSDDQDTSDLIGVFKRDMTDIQKGVLEFTKTWSVQGAVKADPKMFVSQFKGVAEALGERVDREEDVLYELYDGIAIKEKQNALSGMENGVAV